jgi:hypothetical protein
MVLLPCTNCCEWQCPKCDSSCCPCPKWRWVYEDVFSEDQEAWDAYLAEHGIPAGTTYEELDTKCRNSYDTVGRGIHCGYPGGAPGYVWGGYATFETGSPITTTTGALDITGTTGDSIVDAMLAAGWPSYSTDSVAYASNTECEDCEDGRRNCNGSPTPKKIEYTKTVQQGTNLPGRQNAFGCAPAECYRIYTSILKREWCDGINDTYFDFEWMLCPCSGLTLVSAAMIVDDVETPLEITLDSQPITSPDWTIFECYNADNSYSSFPIYPVPQPNPCLEDNPCDP